MTAMGFLEAGGLAYQLSDGRQLFSDVTFRVSPGTVAAMVGANGAGKTTLLRILSGELTPADGGVVVQGGLGVMRQFIGSVRDDSTVRDLLLAVAAPRRCGRGRDGSTPPRLAMMETDDEPTQMRYAQALADWGDAGGYDAEVLWDVVHAWRRSASRTTGRGAAGVTHAVRRRAEAAGAGGAAARPRRGAAAGRAGQLPRRPGKRWLEERLGETPQDGAAGQPRP